VPYVFDSFSREGKPVTDELPLDGTRLAFDR
jgi:hypothetical protein